MSAPMNVNPGSEGSMSKYNANETTETEVPKNAGADNMVLEEERPSLDKTILAIGLNMKDTGDNNNNNIL